MMSVFIFITLEGVTSFSRIKNFDIHVNAAITVKALSVISFHIMAENWKHLKGTLAFISFLVFESK